MKEFIAVEKDLKPKGSAIFAGLLDIVKDPTDIPSWCAKDVYGKILIKSFAQNPLDMVRGINAIVGYCNKVECWAKLEDIFQQLYDTDIITDEAFIFWKESEEEHPGKLKAIIKANAFLTWIEQDEDSDEEDDEEY